MRLVIKVFLGAVIFLCFVGTPISQAGHAAKSIKELKNLEAGLVALAEDTLPAVVNISPYVPPSPSIARGGSNHRLATNAGAGVIIDGKAGYIVTNSHVVRNSDKIQVTLFGGKKVVGRVVGTDDDTDLAVVRIPVDG